MKNNFRKILFIRTDRMGDVLMNLPAIRALRLNYPKSWITLMTDNSVAGLLQGHEDIDELMTVNASAFKNSPLERIRLAMRLRKIRFDLAIVSNPDKNMHAIVFFAGIPVRVGYDRKWPFFLTRRIPEKKDRAGQHEIDSNLALVQDLIVLPWDKKIQLPLNTLALKNIDERIKNFGGGAAPLIAIHTGTSNPKKRWAAERFVELCRKIDEAGLGSPILIGGPEEKDTAAKIQDGLDRKVTDWTGSFTLEELSAFLSHPRVKTLVSCDSGPMHIAWMNEKPVVALYAADLPGAEPARWGPLDGVSRVIHKPMKDISADEVFLALSGVMQGLESRPSRIEKGD